MLLVLIKPKDKWQTKRESFFLLELQNVIKSCDKTPLIDNGPRHSQIHLLLKVKQVRSIRSPQG